MYIYIYICIYVIMKTMFPPSYHHNGFVANYALGHMMYICIYTDEATDKVYICVYVYILTKLL